MKSAEKCRQDATSKSDAYAEWRIKEAVENGYVSTTLFSKAVTEETREKLYNLGFTLEESVGPVDSLSLTVSW